MKYLQYITNFLFLLTLLILTRQFPLSPLSPLMNLACLLLLCISVLRGAKENFYIYFFIYMIFLLLVSVFVQNNDIMNSSKFFIVLLLLVAAHYIVINSAKVIDLAFYLILFQALIVIVIWLFFTINFSDGSDYYPLRRYFLNSGFGDVYTHGVFFKVQIKGNALLPFFYMLSVYVAKHTTGGKYNILAIIYFIATILAGNFMFLVAIFIFHSVYFLISLERIGFCTVKGLRNITLVFAFLLVIPFATKYFIDVVEAKSGKGTSSQARSSMGIRYDQVRVLVDDLAISNKTLLFGQGLGNTIEKVTPSRDYRGSIYYELQTVYILNQLGFINFIIVTTSLLLLFISRVKDQFLRIIYCCYILYALSNPYMFDTNQFVVIVVLLSVQRIYGNSIVQKWKS